MIACYDLSSQLVTFDFYGWMVEQAENGAEEVVFSGTGSLDEATRTRFENIVKPGPAFLGLSSRVGDDGDRGKRAKFAQLIEFAYNNRHFRRLRSVLPPGDARYTVTIRHSDVDTWRNSNRAAWRRFASEIDAVVIEDYAIEPICLHQRMALYAGAEMNFGMSGGPMWMCSLSEYPCMIFGLAKHETYFERRHMRHGERMPWCRKNQFTFWDYDDYDQIVRRFKSWRRQAS